MQQGHSPAGASVSEVRDEIQTISQSRLFAQSRRRIKLLEYLCDMVLLGRQDEIKETTIALEVFERTTEFDDKKDAIVRVEAHRLRERLSKYYATEGSHDPLIIELSPGGYIPRFIAREPAEPAEPATEVVSDPPPLGRRFNDPPTPEFDSNREPQVPATNLRLAGPPRSPRRRLCLRRR